MLSSNSYSTSISAGVILCLCSKNQEADVWSVFDQNPGMLLKREHISFWKINWEVKSANLRALVKEMNIGMDAVRVPG